MKVLLTGANGFIGRPLANALLACGHDVTCVLRPGSRLEGGGAGPERKAVVELDFSTAQSVANWLPLLKDVDLVINTVGIFQEQGGQTFQAVHSLSPVALFDACLRAGVPRVIQLSALGANASAQTEFLLSKKVADDRLLALPLEGVVVQPSLIYASDGVSAALFNRLAVLPVWLLPSGEGPWLQPVHRDDVVMGLQRLAEGSLHDKGRMVFAGPQALTLRQYLQALREQMGSRRAPLSIRLPKKVFLFLGAVAERLPGRLITRDAVTMLMQGNTGDASALTRLLGHPARPPSAFLNTEEAVVTRQLAWLGILLPLARLSLALVWLWTAVVSFGLYPIQDSYALLARVGVSGLVATVLLYGAAALDLVLGLATLAFPSRLRRPLWLCQLVLIAGYTLVISFFLPEFWLHPYGPILKNIPMAMLLVMLLVLEPGRSVTRPITRGAHGIPDR